MLDEGGFVTSQEIDGKKVYTITDKGVELLKERGEKRSEEFPDLGEHAQDDDREEHAQHVGNRAPHHVVTGTSGAIDLTM